MPQQTRKPINHGRDHGPEGADPGRPGFWHYIGDPGEPDFVNGFNAPPSDALPNPVPLRFRIVLGTINRVADDTVADYRHKTLEIQGDVTGVSPGDTVFVMPAAFVLDHDVPVESHDDDGLYVACRLLATGEFIYGVA